MEKEIGDLDDNELIRLYPALLKELKGRGIIRTNNLVGELGEYFVVTHYNSDSRLPNMQLAPKSTQNVDALGYNGERYAIKTIRGSGRTTGVFYGLNSVDDSREEIQKFEYAVIVKLDDELSIERIIQLDWKTFLEYKRWHSRMNAWNLSYTGALIEAGETIYQNE